MSVSPESQMELNCPNPNRPIAGKSDGGDDSQCKKRTNSTRDRLSELPDLALVNILSHLYTEEAARTSVLSKRFNSLWNSVHSLRFSNKYSGKDGVVFISIVDTALASHRRKCIENFSLTLNYNFTYKASVDHWINFAAEKQVKSLHLIVNEKARCRMPRMPDLSYKLPKVLYENETLVELVTCCCDFSMKREINCSRLKFLSIAQTRLTAEMISMILRGCTVLETLELRDYTGFDKLKIDSSSLRVLRVVGEQIPHYLVQPGDNCVLEISGPNLVSLEVSGLLYRTKLRLTDVGSLMNAVMAFTVMHRGRYSPKNLGFATWIEEIAREVLESLCLVEMVTIGGSIMKALSQLEAYNLSSPWSERRSLTLCVPVTGWRHLGLGSLLYSSPYLESLVIRLSYCSDTCVIEHVDSSRIDAEMHYWKSWSTISKCPLLHLRTVKVVGFQVSCLSIKPLFLFLEFLLTNSKVLEELVIQASRYVTRAALNEAMKLLDVRTASPDVVVQFEPPHFWVDPLCMYQETFPLFSTEQT